MTDNEADETLDRLLEDAGELLTRYVIEETLPAATWGRNLETLALYAVVDQQWQDPQAKLAVYLSAMRPVLLAAFEMGREAEREGTA